jgi:hypothetical protein
MQSQNPRNNRKARRAPLDNHLIITLKHLTKQSAGPARPRADGAVNFKTAVNPAKASAGTAVCLVFAENHYFAEIYAVLEESAGAWPGQRFYSLNN